jgi:adenosine deaminase
MAEPVDLESMSIDERIDRFIEQMPKAELHVHLEGAVLPETLLKLAAKHDVELPARDLDGIQDFYTFQDFDHFVRVYMKINDCLKTPEDVGLITEELGAEAARQNIRYVEVTISPGTLTYIHGFTFEEIYEQIKAGGERAGKKHGVRMQYVVDVIRDMPPPVRKEGAEFAIRHKDDGIVALGLGGTESRFPPEQFVDLFDMAYAAGLPSVPHAGETAGPESVWGALTLLRAVRIGHGVRSVDDPALVEHLVEHQIPLEVSPTSNICIGVFSSWEEHPVRELYDAGVPITINSDDPPMFNTTLTQEFREMVQRFNFGIADIEKMTLNALDQSFLPADERTELRQQYQSEFTRLRTSLGLDAF